MPLEKIFLANVCLYLKTIQTVVKFGLINKKCKDALEILRTNPVLTSENFVSENDRNMLEYEKMFENQYELFPQLETLYLTSPEFSFQLFASIPDEINNVRYLANIPFKESIDDFQEYLEELHIDFTLNYIDLSKFTRLKKVVIKRLPVSSKTPDFCQYFTNKKQHFDVVRIPFQKTFSLGFFKQIHERNIDKVIVEIQNQEELDLLLTIPNILKKVKVVCSESNIIYSNENIVLLKMNWVNTIDMNVINKYLPEEISLSSDKDKELHLNDLGICCKKFNFTNGICTLPNNLSVLTLTNAICSNILDLNLKELHLNNVTKCEIPTTVTKLDIKNGNTIHLNAPESLIELSINKYKNDLPFELMNSLTSFTAFNYSINKSLQMLTNLKCLNILSDNGFDNPCSIDVDINSFYPSTLTSLHTSYENLPKQCNVVDIEILFDRDTKKKYDLTQYTTFKNVKIIDCYGKGIQLPTTIEYAHFDGCNMNGDIHLERNTMLKELYFTYTQTNITYPNSLKKLVLGDEGLTYNKVPTSIKLEQFILCNDHDVLSSSCFIDDYAVERIYIDTFQMCHQDDGY